MKLPISLAHPVWKHLGHCSRCTRKAFIAAVAMWVLLFVLFPVVIPMVRVTICALATALTALWSAHVVVYSLKTIKTLRNQAATDVDLGRRASLPSIGRIMGFAIAASLAPRLSTAFLSSPTIDGPQNTSRWKPIGVGQTAKPIRLAAGGCQPVSYGCNSCCDKNTSGNYFIRADCSTGCAMGCGSQKCY